MYVCVQHPPQKSKMYVSADEHNKKQNESFTRVVCVVHEDWGRGSLSVALQISSVVLWLRFFFCGTRWCCWGSFATDLHAFPRALK